MSTSLRTLAGLYEDPRKTRFVLSLLAKTKEGKVSWARKGDAFTATIPNGIVVNFVTGVNVFGVTPSWQLFTVRDKAGNELIQVTAPNSLLSLLAGQPTDINVTDPLARATDELFAAVSGISGDELEQAIESLKKL